LRELPQIGLMVGKLFADVAEIKFPAAFLAGTVAYFLPTEAQQGAALGAAHLIALDTLTGVVAARMTGKAITSAKLGRALVKLLAYSSVLSVAAICIKHIPGASIAQAPTVTGVLTLILATEGISVLENVRAMGVTLPFGLEAFLSGRIPAKEIEKQ
jgi:phage-related holin